LRGSCARFSFSRRPTWPRGSSSSNLMLSFPHFSSGNFFSDMLFFLFLSESLFIPIYELVTSLISFWIISCGAQDT
jgi:hypothetical protein